MSLLLAIAHYCAPNDRAAAERLSLTVRGWGALCSAGTQVFHVPGRRHADDAYEVLIVTDYHHHSLGDLADWPNVRHVRYDGDPLDLPVRARGALFAAGGFDLYAYSEHDNWPVTPTYLRMATLHATQTGGVLLPHRYELAPPPVHKVYIDGPEHGGPDNPHSALWVITQAQRDHWRDQPWAMERGDWAPGPLESGCTWSLMRTFTLHKPSDPTACEALHLGDRYATQAHKRGWA